MRKLLIRIIIIVGLTLSIALVVVIVIFFFRVRYSINMDIKKIMYLNLAEYNTITFKTKENHTITIPIREYSKISIKEVPLDIQKLIIFLKDQKYYIHKDKQNLKLAIIGFLYGKSVLNHYDPGIILKVSHNFLIINMKSTPSISEEAIFAYRLGKKYNRETIFEYYINMIYFLNGIFGINTASRHYFNKDLMKLKPHETAFLLSIANDSITPSIMRNEKILSDVNIVKAKRDSILDIMTKEGLITPEQSDFYKKMSLPQL